MYTVLIALDNGTTIHFYARKFELDPDALENDGIQPLTYTDHEGNETPLYLNFNEVDGVVIAPVGAGGASVISTTR
jgi:hypothetical protein